MATKTRGTPKRPRRPCGKYPGFEKGPRKPRAPLTPAQTELFEANRASAYWMARRSEQVNKLLAARGVYTPERVQTCLEGLWDAARLYDPEYRTADGKPVKFHTYAVNAMRRRLWRELELLQRRAACERQLWRPGANDETDLIAEPECHRTPDPLASLAGADQLAGLRRAVRRLSIREQRVLALRYGLDGDSPIGFREIGALYNVSRTSVMNWIEQACQKLAVYLHEGD